jgi:hypothetical protein
MTIRRWLWVLPAWIVLIAVPPAMAYGPLLPWSPFHPGYEQLTLSRARILYPAGTTLPETYRDTDAWLSEAAAFHQLTVQKSITVVLCRNWSDLHRFVPWIHGNVLAGISLATGRCNLHHPESG